MNRPLAIALLLLLIAPSCAMGHSFGIRVSTPISPPATLVWLWPVSLIVIALSILIPFRFAAGARWLESIIVSIGAVLMFAVVFYFIGISWAHSTTAPPPGLGPPSAVVVRWDMQELVSLFACWNIAGAVILGLAVFAAGRLWLAPRRKRSAIVLVVPVLAYVVLLVPFIATRAVAHGWAGGYVMNAGTDQLTDINYACFRYAKDHGGKFPVAQDVHELIQEVKPYLEKTESRYGNPIFVHPAAWVFEKEPKPFLWNASLSGQETPTLPVYEPEKIPVTCPYGTPVFLDGLEDSP